ncbi:MAG: hypothetical protein KatS3mg039_1523 [Candidatus Kapaibacterium sp.]|nr:MAG: hypothetical protein KatS3mg039_1523 [Candidatus Kapabacteria bacterium]
MLHALTLALIITTAATAATTDSTGTFTALAWHDLQQLPRSIAREPLPTIAASMGSLAAIAWISGADQAIRSAVRAHQSRTLDALASIGNTAGQAWSGAALALLLVAGGAAAGSDHTVTTGRQMLEALAVAGAVTTALKYAIGRARPFRDRGDGYLLPFRWDDAQWSLPSGHATVAGTIAGVTWARSRCWLLRSAATALALVVGGARIYSDKHWTSDVLAGTTIGIATGYGLARSEESSHAWLLLPSPGGIRLCAAW